MWCLIVQPDSRVFEVRGVDSKAIGQECLQKVCDYLGITHESDYFGLKYESNKGEELWLNLRNPIDRQVNCHNHNMAPLRFALRVKFWVPPHLLLQEKTRHQFYLHAHKDLVERRLLATDWDSVARLIALIAQAETGDYEGLNPQYNFYNQLSSISAVEDAGPKPQDLLQRVVAAHKKNRDMKASTAEYWLLKEISGFEAYGEELFVDKQGTVMVGVGPHGITMYDDRNKEKQLISFTSISSASSNRRTFKLEYLSIDNKETQLEVKLDSCHAASSLYRAITEKHAFYSCETVRSAVTDQFIRDLKGTIVSIFNEDSSLGKKYLFDIRRTCREVYDNARRALYQENAQLMANNLPETKYDGDQCKDSNEKLNSILEAFICKICMDNQIDAAFMPCSHVVACTSCAMRCNVCPVCRADITQAQKLYLPCEIRQ